MKIIKIMDYLLCTILSIMLVKAVEDISNPIIKLLIIALGIVAICFFSSLLIGSISYIIFNK